jgi:hypothetical protein
MPFCLARLLSSRPGPRLPRLSRSAHERVALASRSRSSFATDLYSLVRGVVADSLAASTRRLYSSHVAFFHEFMTILGLDTSSFGLPVAQGGFTLKEEETLLSMFAVHCWRAPRRGGHAHQPKRHCWERVFLTGFAWSTSARSRPSPVPRS